MATFKRILLTGIHGQVGHTLHQKLSAFQQYESYELFALDRTQLDLSDSDSIRSAVQAIKPDLIINPAAYTAVDLAESHVEQAHLVNTVAPKILAEEASRINAFFIHYSTDYVFDGLKLFAYTEDDIPSPSSVYGRTKLAGEEAIRAIGLPHLILRTSWIYGIHGKNFLITILRLASKRDFLRVVADQIGAPTSVDTIGRVTIEIIRNIQTGQTGTYHLTNHGETSWYKFAKAIIEIYEHLQISKPWPKLKTHSSQIIPITTSEYPTPASRPANSRLDCNKLKVDFNIALPDWHIALTELMSSPDFETVLNSQIDNASAQLLGVS